MKDARMKIELMYQLEMVLEILSSAKRLDMDGADIVHMDNKDFLELCDRVWAVLYKIQAADGGSRPDNYRRVLERVDERDAAIQVKFVIEDAKGVQ